MRLRKRLTILCCVLGSAMPIVAECDEMSERAAVTTKVVDLFMQQDFAALEALAETFRKEQSRTSSGIWKLSLFNSGVRSAFHSGIKDDHYWIDAKKAASAWVKLYPNSATAHLAYAQMLINRGWSYRGSGYAHTVDPKDWAPFQKHIQEARSYLEKNKEVGSRDPRWYETMSIVARAQSWQEAEYAPMLKEGLERYPSFYQIYFAAIEYYAPKWGGDAQLIESFARESLGRTQSLEGFGMYARIYWYASQTQYKESLFSDSLVDWPTMKKGIDDVLKKYPDSWNINSFAKFSCLSRDKPKTAELIARIDGAPLMSAWGNAETFSRCREWALSGRSTLKN